MVDKITDPREVSSAVSSGYKQDVRAVIEMAVALGWNMIVSNDNSITIISPDERKRYHFSTRRTSGPLRRISKDVWKYASPERVQALEAILGSEMDYEIALNKAADVANALFTVSVEDGAVSPEPEVEEKKKERKEPPRYLVTTRPMMAKARENAAYESKVAMERHWSDGTVDYSCAYPGCIDGPSGRPYCSENRLSVRNHWRKHGQTVERATKDIVKGVEVPNAASYQPRQRRVEALMAALQGIDLNDLESVARAALVWVNEQSRRNTDLSTEREDLTAEETLDRIRNLLDRGERQKAAAEAIEMRETVDSLTVEMQELKRERDKALEELRATQDDLSGLKALFDQITERFGKSAEKLVEED